MPVNEGSSTDVEGLVAQMTLEEKCAMVAGDGAWIVKGCERLGIPEWCLSDGPVGARGRAMGPGLVVLGPSAISATWDPALVEEIGVALGIEGNDRKIDVLLAPTVNLHRSPRGGRHFESYSEDPELSSRIAVAYISGVQSQGIGACVKHFVANDQEFERFTINAEVDERALREIYLPPFEAAVKEADVKSVMGAYNFINGDHGCAHPELLAGVLKDEWGFDGFVVSDWGAIKETVAPARHGLDLEMPGPGRGWGGGKLQASVESGEVDEVLIDDKVRRIVSFLDWRGRIGESTDHAEQSIEHPEHRALVRRAAASSMVLIKNEGSLLPLADAGTVALIGPGVAETAMLGGGSASLTSHRSTNVLDSMTERLGDRLVGTAPGIDMRRKAAPVPPDWIGDDGVLFEIFDGIGFKGEMFDSYTRPATFNVWFGDSWPEGRDTMSVRLSFEMTAAVSGRHRMCALGFSHAKLFVDDVLIADNEVNRFSAGLGQHGGNGYIELEAGQTYRVRMEHAPEEEGQWVCMVDVGVELANLDPEAGIAEAAALAAKADTAVVVVGSNAEWESEGADRDSIDLPNGQDALVSAVVAANPNTVVVLNCGAPMTLPWLDETPAVVLAWYPGQEAGHAIADVLMGDAEPGGRMPTTWARDERDTPAFLNYPGEAGVVRYGEGIFVGYRSYDARGIEPLIPFGHGGSYTSFEWGEATVSGDGFDLVVEVPVTNVGVRAGSEVVQVYVAPEEHVVARPQKELAGFAKIELDSGATGTATIRLKERSFARWDLATHPWIVDEGRYALLLAASATDVRGSLAVTL
jgi:beta-glucosidase